MELKVGMYARVKELNSTSIVKIIEIDQFDNDEFKADNNMFYLVSDIIGEPSFNIIDLIEEDDLLEIEYLIRPDEYQVEELQVIKIYEERLYINAFPRKIFIEDFKEYGVDIKSVVTKEQFDSMKHEVE